MDLPIPTTAKATLKALTSQDAPITVHFNPASMVYTLENSTKQQSRDPKRRQYAAQFTGKLTMDLQFDTTDTGQDVRIVTDKVAQFMNASAKASKGKGGSGNPPAQPVLTFQWGTYEFKGIMESFKETIDFFSANGVALRALVSIGLARQDNVFDEDAKFSSAGTGSVVSTSDGSSATGAATQGGDPNAGRALAAANGLENPRFTEGASLEVSPALQLNAAAGFVASASAGAGFGISAGAGIGISAGASAGIGISAGAGIPVGAGFGASASVGTGFGLAAGASVGAGFGAGISAGAGFSASAGISTGPLFGSRASAGVPATAGAFAGLEVGRASFSTTAHLEPLRMLPSRVVSDVSTSANASYSLGGAATAKAGFSTGVGANFSYNDRLVFDTE